MSRTDPADSAGSKSEQRRRFGKIVHDERGNASVEWHEAPPDYERPVLEVESTTATMRRLQLGLDGKPIRLGDPYASAAPLERKTTQSTGTTTRTDLRKLSEWIKLTRQMEERNKNGDVAVSDDED